MAAADQPSLKSLLLAFLSHQKVVYPPIKLEAFFQSPWLVADNSRTYLKCKFATQNLDPTKSQFYRIRLLKWRFVVKELRNSNRLSVQLEADTYKCFPAERLEFFHGRSKNLVDDREVRQALEGYEERRLELTQETGEIRESKRIKKPTAADPLTRDGFSCKDRQKATTKESTEAERHTSGRKNGCKETDSISVSSDKVRDQGDTEELGRVGYLCHDLTFGEAMTGFELGRARPQAKRFLVELEKNVSKFPVQHFKPRTERRKAPEIEEVDAGCGLLARRGNVPQELLDNPLEVDEILAAIQEGFISWEEIRFSSLVVELLADSAENLLPQ